MEPSDHQAHAVAANSVSPVHTTFSRAVAGLPEATRTAQVELGHGEVFELRATPVRKRVGDAMVKMLAYNGSVPGPTLRVAQGSEVTIIFTNENRHGVNGALARAAAGQPLRRRTGRRPSWDAGANPHRRPVHLPPALS